jgi:hypothetical protein
MATIMDPLAPAGEHRVSLPVTGSDTPPRGVFYIAADGRLRCLVVPVTAPEPVGEMDDEGYGGGDCGEEDLITGTPF